MKLYAVKMSNGSWYRSHGTRCIQVEDAIFPTTTFKEKGDASEEIDRLMRYHPNEAIDCAIIELKVSMREVYADPNERTRGAAA